MMLLCLFTDFLYEMYEKLYVNHNLSTQMCVCMYFLFGFFFNVKGRKCDRFSDGRKYYIPVNDLKLCII